MASNNKQRPEPLMDPSPHPKYEKLKDLNSGTFGFVQQCRNKLTGEQVAIKFMERGEKITKYVEREIINHSSLIHPHVVQFKEVFLTPHYLGIVMEFAPGGDMFHYVVKRTRLPENDARWFFQQLIIGLDYCHRMGVANRDIKLENTLLDGSPRPIVKVCDFGYSKHEQYQSAPGSQVGTPSYFAPEVILNVPGKTYDGKAADVWSCGVMLYVMLVGAYPFERPEDRDDKHKLQTMITRILKVDYVVPSYVKLSEECRDLLRKILVLDPTKRITIEQIYQHPWYTKYLPPGAVEMNNNAQPVPVGAQTQAQIKALIDEARKPNGAPRSGIEADDMIDAELRNIGM